MDDDDQPVELPWDRSPSIYEHLQAHTRPGETGLADGGETLPDEQGMASNAKIRWAPGAMDGVLTHHMGGGSDEDNVARLLNLVRAYWSTPTANNKASVYEFVVENGIVASCPQAAFGPMAR